MKEIKMLKMLATAAMIGSAVFVGFNADVIVAPVAERMSVEVQAVADYFKYDPEAVARSCAADFAPGKRASAKCQQAFRDWVARDGQSLVQRELFKVAMDATWK
jgi:carbonic anhydrase/acetyltransferase-like protein (isoleucine patch superfamily)